jgi:GNAT superfamily N-acetyltransferase
MSTYVIREVDGGEADIADDIVNLHDLAFGKEAPNVTEYDTDVGRWWLAYHNGVPVAFAGLKKSASEPGALYLVRSGVIEGHRGRGLHMRLIRVRERWARKHGWRGLRTDTTDNHRSANNLIRAGFRIFAPELLWSFPRAIYWRKDLA